MTTSSYHILPSLLQEQNIDWYQSLCPGIDTEIYSLIYNIQVKRSTTLVVLTSIHMCVLSLLKTKMAIQEQIVKKFQKCMNGSPGENVLKIWQTKLLSQRQCEWENRYVVVVCANFTSSETTWSLNVGGKGLLTVGIKGSLTVGGKGSLTGRHGFSNCGRQGITNCGNQGFSNCGRQGFSNCGRHGFSNCERQGITNCGRQGITNCVNQGFSNCRRQGFSNCGRQGFSNCGRHGFSNCGRQGITNCGRQGFSNWETMVL